MNLLVTGGTGFIGSHLLSHLLKEGHTLTVLTRDLHHTYRISDLLPKISLLSFDSLNLDQLFKQGNFEGIIHLATCYIKHHTTVAEMEMMNETNITFPSRLLQLACQNNVNFFINTGTCFEYALSDKPIAETFPLNPYDYYAATKVAFEQLLTYYTVHTSLKAVTLRLFYPYGEKDNDKIIPLMVKSLIQNHSIELTPGEQTYSYTYVGDIAWAYCKALEYVTSVKASQYEVFNIGSAAPVTLKAIAHLLTTLNPGKNCLILGAKPYSPHEIMALICDASKANRLLNWQANTSIEEGLIKTYNYYQSNQN